jgi:hypothetical protein
MGGIDEQVLRSSQRTGHLSLQGHDGNPRGVPRGPSLILTRADEFSCCCPWRDFDGCSGALPDVCNDTTCVPLRSRHRSKRRYVAIGCAVSGARSLASTLPWTLGNGTLILRAACSPRHVRRSKAVRQHHRRHDTARGKVPATNLNGPASAYLRGHVHSK